MAKYCVDCGLKVSSKATRCKKCNARKHSLVARLRACKRCNNLYMSYGIRRSKICPDCDKTVVTEDNIRIDKVMVND